MLNVKMHVAIGRGNIPISVRTPIPIVGFEPQNGASGILF